MKSGTCRQRRGSRPAPHAAGNGCVAEVQAYQVTSSASSGLSHTASSTPITSCAHSPQPPCKLHYTLPAAAPPGPLLQDIKAHVMHLILAGHSSTHPPDLTQLSLSHTHTHTYIHRTNIISNYKVPLSHL